MKKILLVAVLALLLSGCSLSGLVEKIPDHEFKKFSYHRAGNITSTHITAVNSVRVDGEITVEQVNITSDYGPFANFNITIEGYRRGN